MNKIMYTVTGATGYIGSNTVKYLLNETEDNFIFAVVRADREIPDFLRHDRIKIVEYDGTMGSLRECVERSQYFIHLGALYITGDDEESINKLIESNIKFSSYIFSLANKYNRGLSVVSASTFSSLNSDGKIEPATYYAATKACVEVIAKLYKDLSIKFLTFPDTYGPNDRRKKIHNILRDNQNWPFTFRSPSSQEMYMLHVNDIIGYIMAALKVDNPGTTIYDIFLEGDRINLKELSNIITDKECLFNEDGNLNILPTRGLGEGNRLWYNKKYNVKKDL